MERSYIKPNSLTFDELAGSALLEVSKRVDELIDYAAQEVPDTASVEFLDKVAEGVPNRIPKELQQEIIQAVKSFDPETSALGQKVLLFLNSRDIAEAVRPYLGQDPDFNQEILQTVMERVLSVFRSPTRHFVEYIGAPLVTEAKRAVRYHQARVSRIAEYEILTVPNLEETMEREWELLEIRDFLQVISTGYLQGERRQVIERRFWGRLSYREIAGDLGVDEKKVKQIEADALAGLRFRGRQERSRSGWWMWDLGI